MAQNIYALEFVLNTHDCRPELIRNSLLEFAEEIQVIVQDNELESGNAYKINLRAFDPTLIFDICGQYGRITSAKIDQAVS